MEPFVYVAIMYTLYTYTNYKLSSYKPFVYVYDARKAPLLLPHDPAPRPGREELRMRAPDCAVRREDLLRPGHGEPVRRLGPEEQPRAAHLGKKRIKSPLAIPSFLAELANFLKVCSSFLLFFALVFLFSGNG